MNEQFPQSYEFGEFRLDAARRLLRRNGASVPLAPKAFDVLLILVSRHGQIVTKDFLMQSVWPETTVEENSLNVNVSALRRIFGEKPREHRFIATVPGIGYQFVADVQEISGGAKAVVENETPAHQSANLSEKSAPLQTIGKNWIFLIASVALVTVAIFAYRSINSRTQWSEVPVVNRTLQVTSWSGLDFYPAVSADGNSVTFSSDRTGSFEIYVKQIVAGAREIQITADGGQNFEPSFSPDGNLIVFHSKKRGGIWLIPSTGGTAKQITEWGSHPAWSPDGSQIVFQSDPLTDLGFNAANAMPPSTIWVVPARGGEPRQLTQPGNPLGGHGAPSWSPNGKRILFSSSDLFGSDAWSVSLQGDDLKKVFPGVVEAVYAPDGKSVFALDGRVLGKIDVSEDGTPIGEPVKIFDASGPRIRHMSISANNKRIAYTSISTVSNIWSTPLNPKTNEASGEPVQFTKSVNARNATPAFSPDGKKIAYQPSSAGLFGSTWIMNADGTNQYQLTATASGSPWWFNDGKHLAFRAFRNDESSLWVIETESGLEKKLFDFDGDVTFVRLSPDGKRVAFNSKRDGSLNIWTMTIDGKNIKQLTFDREMMAFPAWSPDGKWLSFQMKRGDNTYVGIIPSDGGEPVQLTFDEGQSWSYDWSPDGDKVIFAGQRNDIWNAFWVSRSTKQQKQLTNFTKFNAYVRYPVWSPAGDRIAYEYAETTGNIWMIELK